MVRSLIASLVLLVPACDGASPADADATTPDATTPDVSLPADPVVASTLPRLTAAEVPASDVAAQVRDNTTFAFRLYRELAVGDGDVFFSPFSVSSALAMAWAGAAGDTATAMREALSLSLPAPAVHGALNALDLAFAERVGADHGALGGDPRFSLAIANALWGQRGLDFQAPFLDTLAQNYGAGVRVEDFSGAPAQAAADINAWVDEATHGKIPEIIAPESITPDTRVVLTNAIYFKAQWAWPFRPDLTAPGPFHRLDGATATVPLMHQSMKVQYAAGPGWQAVELPYATLDAMMTVLVPDEGALATVEAGLDADFLDGLVASEEEAEVELALPKFTVTTIAPLRAPLTALGMGVAFTDAADFSGIADGGGLELSEVAHQATVTIDEVGTEAAAVTDALMQDFADPPLSVTLTIDRPFIVLVRDRPTGSVLFLGRVAAP